MEKLRGKTALVTGSTDGVGRLVARKLGQAGARVLDQRPHAWRSVQSLVPQGCSTTGGVDLGRMALAGCTGPG